MNQDLPDFFSEPAQWPSVILHRTSTFEIRQPQAPVPVIPVQSGHHEESESESSQSAVLNRFDLFRMNVSRHPYSRAYHYYFDLSTFKKDEASISYVKDPVNSLKSTFSKDQIAIGGSKLKNIINREYFTLPSRTEDSRPSRAKNPSHENLFQTEDKKLSLDRLIVTYRQIINNIEQLVHTGKLNNFYCLRRDAKVKEILSPIFSISEKRQLLINRLEQLVQGKRLGERQWAAEDNIHLAPSINQKHYQSSLSKFLMLDRSKLIKPLEANHAYLKEIIEKPIHVPIGQFVSQAFTPYRELKSLLKNRTIQHVCFNYKHKILQVYRGHSAVIFPALILSFSDTKIFDITSQILGKRLSATSPVEFEQLNKLCNKLFNKSLFSSEEFQIEDQYLFKLAASQHLSKIRKFKAEQKFQINNQRQHQMLDDQINYEGLPLAEGQVFILKRRQNIEITHTEYHSLMMWHLMTTIIKEMYPYIETNREFIDIIACPHYQKISQSISEAFKSPNIAVLEFCLNEIGLNLITDKHSTFDDFKLEFQFREDKNLTILWRIENQPQPSQKADKQEQEIDYDILYFGKRIKSLQNEWV